MYKKSDNKGQTLVIGTLLIFSLVIAIIIFFQINIFPDINENTELEAQGEAASSMIELKSTIESTSATGISQTTLFHNEVSYIPQPAGPSNQRGQISMHSTEPMTLNGFEDAEFTDSEGDVNDINRIIIYEPSYIEASETRDIRLDNTLVLERTPESLDYATLSNQNLITGNTINLFVLDSVGDGTLQTNPSINVDLMESNQAELNTSNPQIEFTSSVNRDIWAEQLSDEPNVQSVQQNNNRIVVSLEEQQYNVNYSKLRIRF